MKDAPSFFSEKNTILVSCSPFITPYVKEEIEKLGLEAKNNDSDSGLVRLTAARLNSGKKLRPRALSRAHAALASWKKPPNLMLVGLDGNAIILGRGTSRKPASQWPCRGTPTRDPPPSFGHSDAMSDSGPW